jgi:hypothetical protein
MPGRAQFTCKPHILPSHSTPPGAHHMPTKQSSRPHGRNNGRHFFLSYIRYLSRPALTVLDVSYSPDAAPHARGLSSNDEAQTATVPASACTDSSPIAPKLQSCLRGAGVRCRRGMERAAAKAPEMHGPTGRSQAAPQLRTTPPGLYRQWSVLPFSFKASVAISRADTELTHLGPAKHTCRRW